jgi:heme-degrading monooxygenase HmoA
MTAKFSNPRCGPRINVQARLVSSIRRCGGDGGIIWFPWQPGPEDDTDRPVIVSLTEFTAYSLWSFPDIVRRGTQLQLGWYGLPGAVRVHLWADPLTHRAGSVSVWADRRSLYRWVQLPLHRTIMHRYRTRGTVRSTLWESESPDRNSILVEAKRRVVSGEIS